MLTMTITDITTDEHGNVEATSTVLWNGVAVGTAMWLAPDWQTTEKDRWHYHGDSRDCWADSDLDAFLGQHDPEETPDVADPVEPEDIRALVASAVQAHDRRDWDA